jgi:hypothetical protein
MKQITSRISDETFNELDQISISTERSISYTISVLLQQAIKERLRKRNGKKSDTELNSPNMGQSNGQ